MQPPIIHITIGPKIAISSWALPDEIAEKFRSDCTWTNLEYSRAKSQGYWTGNIPKSITLAGCNDQGEILLPTGYFPGVIAELRKHSLPFRIDDHRVKPEMSERITLQGALYDYQERALSELLRHRTATLEGVTGCGKTCILLAAVDRLQTPTLILTHTRGLMEQMISRCRSFLGYESGQIGNGRFFVKDVTVGTVQTLSRRNIDDLSSRFGAVLTDETHHVAAGTWAKVVQSFNSMYRYGFSGTAWRKDGLTPMITAINGRITARITREDCERFGQIVGADVVPIETDFFFPMADSREWGRMLEELTGDQARNELIAETVRQYLPGGDNALILTDRIAHAETLGKMLQEFEPVVIHGQLPKREQDRRMETIRKGTALTIGTTSFLGEGIDVPAWGILFLASPMAKGSRVIQAKGRIVRARPGKGRALIVDFIDYRMPFLVAAARGRHRLLAA